MKVQLLPGRAPVILMMQRLLLQEALLTGEEVATCLCWCSSEGGSETIALVPEHITLF
jgi:hypothetical protein